MKSWNTTQAYITEFQLQEENHCYWPDIEYQYQVDGQTFVSAYLFADTIHNSPNSQYARKLAHKAAVAYKNEAPILVYYNPKAPEQAVMDIRVPRKLLFIILALSALVLFELSLWFSRIFF